MQKVSSAEQGVEQTRDERDRRRNCVAQQQGRTTVGQQPLEQAKLKAPGCRDVRSGRPHVDGLESRCRERRLQPLAGEVRTVARKLQWKPVLAEGASLPRGPI